MKHFLLRRWKAIRWALGGRYWADDDRKSDDGEVLVSSIDEHARWSTSSASLLLAINVGLGILAISALAIDSNARIGAQLLVCLVVLIAMFLSSDVWIRQMRTLALARFVARDKTFNDIFRLPGEPVTFDADYDDVDDDDYDDERAA